MNFLCMIDYDTAGTMRLVGLLGLGVSICLWVLAEQRGPRKTMLLLSTGSALFCALIYFLGVMAASDSGITRFLPRFP